VRVEAELALPALRAAARLEVTVNVTVAEVSLQDSSER